MIPDLSTVKRGLCVFLAPATLTMTGCSGHGMHAGHSFEDVDRWVARFEAPGRAAWQHPDRVVEALSLEPGHVVAEIGSGTGYFPVRIAPRVPQGRVWGIDIEPAMVRYLNQRARADGLANLFSTLGTPDDALLPEPVDRVLLVDTYHHIEHREIYFEKLRPLLKPDARVVIVDFHKGDLPVGPPDAMKLAPETVQAEMQSAGYRLVQPDAGELPYQYLLVFTVVGVRVPAVWVLSPAPPGEPVP